MKRYQINRYEKMIRDYRKNQFIPKFGGFNWAAIALSGALTVCAILSPIMYFDGAAPDEFFKAASRILLESVPVAMIIEMSLINIKNRIFDPLTKRIEKKDQPILGPYLLRSTPLEPY